MDRKEKIEALRGMSVDVKGNISNEDLDELYEQTMAEKAIEDKAANAPVADVEPEVVDTPKEKTAIEKANDRREAHKMIKCIITPLDDKMKTLPSEMYSVGNKNIGFIKKVVRFGRVTIEPKAIVDVIKEKKALIQQTTEINGKPVTRKVMMPAFSIQELEFTAEELAEFKK